MNTPTPGPWTAEAFSSQYQSPCYIVYGENDRTKVCTVQDYGLPEDKANALLIAAAPDLLAVCKDIQANQGRLSRQTWADLHAALAKAGASR